MSACFDEGTLQAYADGELPAARAAEVAAHLDSCASCASAVNEAAEQFALLSSALEVREPLSVPTERLRARIDAGVAELRPTRAARPAASASLVERLRAFAASLAASLAAPRQATAFASLLVAAVLLAAVFYAFRTRTAAPQNEQTAANEIARVNPPAGAGTSAGGQGVVNDQHADGAQNKEVAGPVEPKAADAGVGGGARNVVNRAREQQDGPAGFTTASYRRPSDARGASARAGGGEASEAALLPVEKSYAEAVASLKSSIERQKAQTMTPTLRAEYERNLAVVDRAIDASRAAARRDPSDKGAQEFLRAAYQDKLELLRAVADQTQIASLGR